jgi:hypothetical protein
MKFHLISFRSFRDKRHGWTDRRTWYSLVIDETPIGTPLGNGHGQAFRYGRAQDTGQFAGDFVTDGRTEERGTHL